MLLWIIFGWRRFFVTFESEVFPFVSFEDDCFKLKKYKICSLLGMNCQSDIVGKSCINQCWGEMDSRTPVA
jgi:hypothetical protein